MARLRKSLLFLILLLLIGIGGFALYTWLMLDVYSYSAGDRAGYVQKFSKKGWVCKTWEGELAMVNLPGAMPQIFQFSVRDDAVGPPAFGPAAASRVVFLPHGRPGQFNIN